MFNVFIDQFWQLTISGIALGFIYVLIALGYTMVYGVLRMINFANSEIFMWGTFGAIVASRDLFGYTQISEPESGGKLVLVLLVQLLFSMAFAGLTAVFVEFVAYRRLRARGTNRLATLISAIGISMVLSEIARLMTDSRPVGSPRVLNKTVLENLEPELYFYGYGKQATAPTGASSTGTYTVAGYVNKSVAIRNIQRSLRGSSIQIKLSGSSTGKIYIRAVHLQMYDGNITR
jgi:branched-subunit amino acid ABC-type transport system permease component